jgi:site-specific DNA recombinase
MVPASVERQSVGRAERTFPGRLESRQSPGGLPRERHPHPNPIKAAEGRTKTRLTEDPVYGPIVALIYRWRVSEHLGKPTIRARQAADPAAYPAPGPAGWSLALVDEILSNPKYTGHQVMGRRRKAGKKVWMPASEWIWSAEPTHTPLLDMATWDAAQRIGRRHGNVRDPEMPTRRTGRRYKLRSRLYCSICHRRLSGTTIRTHTYYRCPHDPGLPRHYAAHPDHRTVAVREDVMTAALARFFAERVFGPDRTAMLAAQLPASAAGQAERRDKQAAAIRHKLARIDTAEAALIAELETPADPGDPAAQALRQRIRARFTDLYTQRTTLEAELAALEDTPAQQANDPTLLEELPILGDMFTQAPAGLTERLLDAFDIQAVYNRDKDQVTVHATLTDATPRSSAAYSLTPAPTTTPHQSHNRAPQAKITLAIQPGTLGSPPRANTVGEVPPRGREAHSGGSGGSPPGPTRGVVPPGQHSA